MDVQRGDLRAGAARGRRGGAAGVRRHAGGGDPAGRRGLRRRAHGVRPPGDAGGRPPVLRDDEAGARRGGDEAALRLHGGPPGPRREGRGGARARAGDAGGAPRRRLAVPAQRLQSAREGGARGAGGKEADGDGHRQCRGLPAPLEPVRARRQVGGGGGGADGDGGRGAAAGGRHQRRGGRRDAAQFRLPGPVAPAEPPDLRDAPGGGVAAEVRGVLAGDLSGGRRRRRRGGETAGPRRAQPEARHCLRPHQHPPWISHQDREEPQNVRRLPHLQQARLQGLRPGARRQGARQVPPLQGRNLHLRRLLVEW